MELTVTEKQRLRRLKIRTADILGCSVEELAVLLAATLPRARHIHALAAFQQVSSIGIAFAKDLIDLGFYSFSELKGQDPARLVEDFERLKGYWIDPCVEDQFRLIVHYADTGDNSGNWWEFTPIRKAYREKHGYPPDRPVAAWHTIRK